MQSLERTMLVTFLCADLQLTDEETNRIWSFELYEEWFKDNYFKLIVKTINTLRQQNKPVYFEYVAEKMQKDGTFNEHAFMDIRETNPLTANTYFNYMEDFKGHSLKSMHGDI